MSLHHFFDNDLGGSLHGKSRSGLTILGHLALAEMQKCRNAEMQKCRN
jgi:membrane dipeptidase